jgi:histidyl-tRNA synthetase
MDELGLFAPVDESGSAAQVLIINDGAEHQPLAYHLLQLLHSVGLRAEYYPEPAKRKGDFVDYTKQLKYANAKGISFAVLAIHTEGAGPQPLLRLTVRNLRTGLQEDLLSGEAIDVFRCSLGV